MLKRETEEVLRRPGGRLRVQGPYSGACQYQAPRARRSLGTTLKMPVSGSRPKKSPSPGEAMARHTRRLIPTVKPTDGIGTGETSPGNAVRESSISRRESMKT